jgi:hypothetical protein
LLRDQNLSTTRWVSPDGRRRKKGNFENGQLNKGTILHFSSAPLRCYMKAHFHQWWGKNFWWKERGVVWKTCRQVVSGGTKERKRSTL